MCGVVEGDGGCRQGGGCGVESHWLGLCPSRAMVDNEEEGVELDGISMMGVSPQL